MLLCVLELMEIPPDKKNDSGSEEEENFKEMLDWSDVWVILFKARGMFCLFSQL